MRYNTTIAYEGKEMTVRVTTQALAGKYALPEFLKTARLAKGHKLEETATRTDNLPSDCQGYENGTLRVPRSYLESFTESYKLPAKIKYLGYEPETERKTLLASRIRELRLSREFTQEICAAMLDVARGTYACYETGKNEPDVKTLIRIADIYKVSLDYLVGRFDMHSA